MRRAGLAFLIAFAAACTDNNPNSIDLPDLGGSGFAVGGVVEGLRGAVILSNNGDDLLQVSASGPFHFFSRMENGASYEVTVFEQPESQDCVVDAGQGTINAADVMNVLVTCADRDHSISGTISGLMGTVVLVNVIVNGGGDDLTLDADGDFTF